MASASRICAGVCLLTAAFCAGCASREPGPKSVEPAFPGLTLTVGAVGDPAILQTLASLRGEWVATRGATINVVERTLDPETAKGVDVVLFPGTRLGDLVDQQTLAILPSTVTRPRPTDEASEEVRDQAHATEPAPDPMQFSDVAPAYRDQVSKYGSDRIGLPYAGSALVLVYRTGAFRNEALRALAGKANLALEPPKTWEQLDALARFLHEQKWADGPAAGSGIAVALGNDPEGVADAALLTRAASLGQHRDQYSFLFDADTMAPRIDSPPFVEALRGMIGLAASGPAGMAQFDAEAARRAFREGKVALLIDRAERASSWGDARGIGVAALPGSERVYDPARGLWEEVSPPNQPSYLPNGGGWLVGVSASAEGQRREAAIDFAQYLISPDTSSRLRVDRTFPLLPVRSAQVAQGFTDSRATPGLDRRLWADAVSRTLFAARVVPGLRIPDADGYLAELSQGRAAALGGESPEAALKGVATAWAARTSKLGVERQLWHYRRSLNSLATLPTPPSR